MIEGLKKLDGMLDEDFDELNRLLTKYNPEEILLVLSDIAGTKSEAYASVDKTPQMFMCMAYWEAIRQILWDCHLKLMEATP